jgi:hypothetical protein
MEKKEQLVHKITLSTKKVVMLREPKIKHQELAQKAIGKRGSDDQMLYATLLQKELLKILLHSVDEKPVDQIKLSSEDGLDDLFSFGEYTQLNQALSQIMGGASGEAMPTLELTIIGGK